MKLSSLASRCRSWSELKAHVVFEVKVLLLEWKALLFGLAWQYIHNIFHNTAYWMQSKLSLAQRMPLYDLGFELLPELTESEAHVSEYLVFGGIFGPSILLFVSVLVIKPSSPSAPPRFFSLIAKRVLLQTALCLMLRCISFMVTSLPGPAAHCRPTFNQTCIDAFPNDPSASFRCVVPNPDFQPPMTAGTIFGHVDALNGCGDLMFSSHTTYTLSMILAVWKYWRSVPLLVLMLVLQIITAFFIVAARKHYSLDVIAALYVVPMVWFLLEAYHKDLNHADAVVSRESIQNAYGLDIPHESSRLESNQATLVQCEMTAFHEAQTPIVVQS
ncbi:hypothetical protein H310_07470 [Aphanomyces invadans]|uniref:Sphingomyelin synthase-like domain-containing protein n=1 Tax=Aphanomyces invadans TaxID=157072 RepID=A0A024U1B1_9STRA|nr:hypothetical protein H310_07470 [Aphanomyces invadans]ETW00034.1 hypothetical protein H310_07470 [Aphanomyces invadans]|eukprot:XP_008871059.1 hypothetical protein H310_07470 [Aphanomyces invadans]